MEFKLQLFLGILLWLDKSHAQDPPNNNTEVKTKGGNVPDGTLCYFPFQYNGVERYRCITEGLGTLWCSTVYNYDAFGEFGFCDLSTVCSGTEGPSTTGGTASGKKCCFPFVYESRSHSDCIVTEDRDDRPDGAWCPIADEYTPGTEWGYCSEEKPVPPNTNTEIRVEDGNVPDGTLCYFPFVHNGEERTQCVQGGKISSRPWCGTTYNYDSDGDFGYCVTQTPGTCSGSSGGRATVGGTSDGAACCFPFTYDGQARSGCIRTENRTEGPWCGTTDNYDVDNMWGYCQDEPPIDAECSGSRGKDTKKGNSNGAKCCFPFIHNSQSKSKCIQTSDKSNGSWCATTDNYDIDGKWGYCDMNTSSAPVNTFSAVLVIFASTLSLS